jgi:hypothetical protein
MTKLNHLISILKPKDIKIFKESILSPMLGGSQIHLNALEQAIKKDRLSTSDVHTRLIMSELCSMIEKFIVMRQSIEDNYYSDTVLLKTYRYFEDEKLFSLLYNKTKFSPVKCSDYEYSSKVSFERWQFDQLKSRFSNDDVSNIILHHDISAIYHKLKLTVTLASQASLIKKEQDHGILNELLYYIEQRNLLHIKELAAYYYVWKMMQEPHVDYWFGQYIDILKNHSHTLNEDDVGALYFHAINYCIRRYNTGEKQYAEFLLDYYLMGLEKGYLLTHGYLSRNTYRNICTIALRLGRSTDAKITTEQYANFLRQEDRESAYNFNISNIAYYDKMYDEALVALRKVDFDDHLSNLFAKTLMLKIYYETSQLRLLESHLDAMKIYLIRKKVVGYHKANYTKIINYMRRIINLNPYDSNSKILLKSKIESENTLPDKEWLLRQLS